MVRTKRPQQAHAEFVFHVRAPSLSYRFGIEHDRKRREWRPLDESEAMHFITECIWPDRFNARESKATLYPEDAFVDHKRLDGEDVRRKWIGYVRATKSECEAVIWLPPSVCWRLGEAMAMGLVRSMLVNSIVEPRGMHRVRSVSFHGVEFDPVAYVG